MDREATLAGSRTQADMLGLADALVDEIAGARRHYAGLRATLEGGGESDERPKSRAIVDEAELAVVAMALAGSTREQAAEHLRDDFGIEDPDELLDRAPEKWPDKPRKRGRRRFGRRLRASR
jgi:hypothetical protein